MSFDKFKDFFDDEVQESFSTAFVLTSPSTLSKEMAVELANELNFKPILPRIGTIVGQAFADGLESRGLRPSDYADLKELSKVGIMRLVEALQDNSSSFADAFVAQLRMRG